MDELLDAGGKGGVAAEANGVTGKEGDVDVSGGVGWPWDAERARGEGLVGERGGVGSRTGEDNLMSGGGGVWDERDRFGVDCDSNGVEACKGSRFGGERGAFKNGSKEENGPLFNG